MSGCPMFVAGFERITCANSILFQIGRAFTEKEISEQWRHPRGSCSEGMILTCCLGHCLVTFLKHSSSCWYLASVLRVLFGL
jgi:hypothetical protein